MPAVGQHSQPIILKVPESIRSPGDHFFLPYRIPGTHRRRQNRSRNCQSGAPCAKEFRQSNRGAYSQSLSGMAGGGRDPRNDYRALFLHHTGCVILQPCHKETTQDKKAVLTLSKNSPERVRRGYSGKKELVGKHPTRFRPLIAVRTK